jgi:hypothetical protein
MFQGIFISYFFPKLTIENRERFDSFLKLTPLYFACVQMLFSD